MNEEECVLIDGKWERKRKTHSTSSLQIDERLGYCFHMQMYGAMLASIANIYKGLAISHQPHSHLIWREHNCVRLTSVETRSFSLLSFRLLTHFLCRTFTNLNKFACIFLWCSICSSIFLLYFTIIMRLTTYTISFYAL